MRGERRASHTDRPIFFFFSRFFTSPMLRSLYVLLRHLMGRFPTYFPRKEGRREGG